MSAIFDIVIPVYNSYHLARPCIESVLKYSTLPCSITIIDDCSDEHVSKAIHEQVNNTEVSEKAQVTILRNDTNQGYLHSCNRGISAGSAPFVIVLNSDTYVFRDYLERIANVFQEDDSIGVINPVSTWANLSRIPFPDGFTMFELDEVTKQRVPVTHPAPDMHNASGFCFAVRRSLFEEIGLFDEEFSPGYYEEADFCMKALDAGHRVVVAPWLYIFHHGWGTFGQQQRNLHMERNKEKFEAKWGKRCDQLNKDFLSNSPIPTFFSEKSLWQSKDTFSENTVEVGPNAAEAIATSLLESKEESQFAADYRICDTEPPKNGKVIYLLPSLKLYGGIISVIQLVNQLILRGIDANIAVSGECDYESLRGIPMYFRPYVFESEGELLSKLPEAELVIATSWRTTYTALGLKSLRGSKLLYFVQDYECDFYRGVDSVDEERALRTYSLIPDKIVKSEWLERKMRQFGGSVQRIPIGLNTDVFYDRKKERKHQVISMARISSRYRNYPMIVEVYNELAMRVPDLGLGLFGFGYTPGDFPDKLNDYGKLSSPIEVAKALNESTILLDCSLWQGFGRPGLEGMATGAACVLTRAGGITQYAKHEENCLLIDPTNATAIVDAIERLHRDNELREKLISAGHEVVKQYSYIDEGQKTAELITKILNKPAPDSQASRIAAVG